MAQTTTLDAPGASDALVRALNNASLVVGLQGQDAEADTQDIVAAARADYRRLLTALYAAGFYSGSISIKIDGREAAGIAPLDAPSAVNTVAISVDTGPAFSFGNVAIGPLPPQTVLPEVLDPGERARSSAIRDGVVAAVDGWRDAGHAKAGAADQQIVARHSEAVLDASVAIAPGPRLTFGPMAVSGNVAVREGAIRRIAGLPIGAIYSPAEIAAAERRLRQTGTFDSASITEDDGIGPGDTLLTTLLLAESKPRRFGFGIELSSVEGLTVSGFWMHRNAFGGAERFRAEAEVSGLGGETGGTDYRLSASLGVPAVYGTDTDFLATATVSREDEPDYLIDKLGIEVEATRLITDDLTLGFGVGLLKAREESALGKRDYTLLTLPLSARLDRRDDPANAKRGYYLDVDATPFIGLDGGSTGGRIYVDGRGYLSFGADDRFTIAARTQIGSLIGAGPADAPADFLFYSGGSGSVRGQPYQSLGLTRTVSGTEITTGGTSFAGLQLEARTIVTDAISVVGFYDYGHVGASEVPLEDGDWQSGLGVGVRYDTGIGPIRLDIGTPANGDDAFGSVQVYIGIGQAF